MTTSWVLKLGHSDDQGDVVLLHVTNKDAHELDLDLVATEGSTVFKGKTRKRSLKKLTANVYNGTEDEWEAILRYALLDNASSAINDEQRRSLEIVASVKGKDPKKTLSILFRNRIDDITQRIGAIELPQDDEEEISLFDWLALTVDRQVSVKSELIALKQRTNEDQATIASLQSQLEDLVKAKEEHEEQLLSKCVSLLNEKKLKIRDQQRVISSSRPNKESIAQLQLSFKGRQTKSTSRRTGKRAAEEAEDSESEGFETMDIDRQQNPQRDMDSDRATTPSIATASEGEEDIVGSAAPPTKASTRSNVPPKTSNPKATRSLPVGNKGQKGNALETDKTNPVEKMLEDDEETASEDDEL